MQETKETKEKYLFLVPFSSASIEFGLSERDLGGNVGSPRKGRDSLTYTVSIDTIDNDAEPNATKENIEEYANSEQEKEYSLEMELHEKSFCEEKEQRIEDSSKNEKEKYEDSNEKSNKKNELNFFKLLPCQIYEGFSNGVTGNIHNKNNVKTDKEEIKNSPLSYRQKQFMAEKPRFLIHKSPKESKQSQSPLKCQTSHKYIPQLPEITEKSCHPQNFLKKVLFSKLSNEISSTLTQNIDGKFYGSLSLMNTNSSYPSFVSYLNLSEPSISQLSVNRESLNTIKQTEEKTLKEINLAEKSTKNMHNLYKKQDSFYEINNLGTYQHCFFYDQMRNKRHSKSLSNKNKLESLNKSQNKEQNVRKSLAKKMYDKERKVKSTLIKKNIIENLYVSETDHYLPRIIEGCKESYKGKFSNDRNSTKDKDKDKGILFNREKSKSNILVLLAQKIDFKQKESGNQHSEKKERRKAISHI